MTLETDVDSRVADGEIGEPQPVERFRQAAARKRDAFP